MFMLILLRNDAVTRDDDIRRCYMMDPPIARQRRHERGSLRRCRVDVATLRHADDAMVMLLSITRLLRCRSRYVTVIREEMSYNVVRE